MKTVLTIFLGILFSGSLLAQSLNISVDSKTQNNALGQFTVGGNTLTVGANYNAATEDISRDLLTSANLSTAGITITGANGNTLLDASYNYPEQRDPSLGVYVFNDGSFIVRENISIFHFYDSYGKVTGTFNNRAGSPDGEAISEIVVSKTGQTIVFYNPKIILDGKSASRAYVSASSTSGGTEFYFSNSNEIRKVEVSDNGAFIAIITDDNKVVMFDKFGNELNQIEYDRELIGASWSSDGMFLTVYSASRIGVYSVVSGERVASSTVRGQNTLLKATYFPEDQVVLAVTGKKEGGELSGIEGHVVSVKARKLARKEFSGKLGITSSIPLSFVRNRANSFTLNGLSKSLNFRASF